MLTKAERTRLRDEMRERLKRYDFSHFITLATNSMDAGEARMRALLKSWDARTNRALNGPQWQRRPEQRLIWFAFPEKIVGNPHWHLVAQVDQNLDTPERQARAARFPLKAEFTWNDLCRSGSFDCRPVANDGVVSYITKELSGLENYERFVFWREFMND